MDERPSNQDHIFNFRQDITKIARLTEDNDDIITQKEAVDMNVQHEMLLRESQSRAWIQDCQKKMTLIVII